MNTPTLAPSVSSVAKPKKVIVPLAVGLTWGADADYLYQEKMDGVFATREIIVNHFRIAILAGEQMPDGTFHAFDCLEYLKEDLRNHPLGRRYIAFNSILEHSPLPTDVRRVPESHDGGAFLAEILARGGEGIVRKSRNDLWGTPMEVCKRIETFYCVVTSTGSTQSVQISRLVGHWCPNAPSSAVSPVGETLPPNVLPASCRPVQNSAFDVRCSPSSPFPIPCGAVKLGGGKCDRVRAGSIIKVEGFGLTAAGMIREPRPCKDTPTSWLVKY